jgi:hypothetical protein
MKTLTPTPTLSDVTAFCEAFGVDPMTAAAALALALAAALVRLVF